MSSLSRTERSQLRRRYDRSSKKITFEEFCRRNARIRNPPPTPVAAVKETETETETEKPSSIEEKVESESETPTGEGGSAWFARAYQKTVKSTVDTPATTTTIEDSDEVEVEVGSSSTATTTTAWNEDSEELAISDHFGEDEKEEAVVTAFSDLNIDEITFPLTATNAVETEVLASNVGVEVEVEDVLTKTLQHMPATSTTVSSILTALPDMLVEAGGAFDVQHAARDIIQSANADQRAHMSRLVHHLNRELRRTDPVRQQRKQRRIQIAARDEAEQTVRYTAHHVHDDVDMSAFTALATNWLNSATITSLSSSSMTRAGASGKKKSSGGGSSKPVILLLPPSSTVEDRRALSSIQIERYIIPQSCYDQKNGRFTSVANDVYVICRSGSFIRRANDGQVVSFDRRPIRLGNRMLGFRIGDVI